MPLSLGPGRPQRFRRTGSTAVPAQRGTPLLPGQLAAGRILVEFAWGANLNVDSSSWVWSDETARVRLASNISITPIGRQDETSQASAAGCVFQLDNTSGDYSPYNPSSIHYPFVRRQTPVRISVDSGTTGWVTRFFGFANGFVPSWDITGNLAIVTVSASGLLRRLTQGKTPLRSAMYRSILTSSPIAYWPMEDGASATRALSALPGGAPMTGPGITKFGQVGAAGSGTQMSMTPTDAVLIGRVPTTTSTSWRVEISALVSTTVGPHYVSIVDAFPQGGVNYWHLVSIDLPNGGIQFAQYAADGVSSIVNTTNVACDDGRWHVFRIEVTQSGADSIGVFSLDGVAISTITATGRAFGPVSAIRLWNTSSVIPLGAALFGHVTVWAPFPSTSTLNTYNTLLGRPGETTTARVARLCAEEGVTVSISGTSPTTMGAQGIGAFVDLLRECETAEDGLLYDGLGPGLGFLTRSQRYNLPAALSADMGADPPQVAAPFSPTDDDQRNRNLMAVTQLGGSSQTYQDSTGVLGTDAIGVYDSALTVNVQADSVVLDRAAWEVHKGTAEGYRYPQLLLNLAATPALVGAWLSMPLAGRLDVLNVVTRATQHPPGTVSLLNEGYSETLGTFTWDVVINCSPYSSWRILQVAAESGDTNPYVGHLDTDGSSLTVGVNATATTFTVTTPIGPVWTTKADDFPFDLNIEGEQVTVTLVTGATNPQTMTVVRSVNGITKAHPATAALSLWAPLVLAL